MSVELAISVLLIVGLAFMMLEAIVPAFGLFGLGGAFSFFAALVMLYDLESFYGMQVDTPLLSALGLLGLAVLGGSLYFIRVAWKTKAGAGAETMIGMTARVLEWSGTSGRVHIDGEAWAAQGPHGLATGEFVTVTARNQLVLTVTKDS